MASYSQNHTQTHSYARLVQFIIVCIYISNVFLQSTKNECTWQTYGKSIMCFMRTIDNASAIDFSDVDGTATTRTLSIHCDNTIIDESVISAGFFHKLDNLEQIIIDGCKLMHLINSSFTGLRNLQRIDIESPNNEWSDNNKLKIDSGIFVDHPNVNSIKLTQNNLREFPYEILCPLKSLETLNISHNRIDSFGDSGFNFDGGYCNGTRNSFNDLEMLDISYNQLISIDWSESNFSQLKELRLQHNNLTNIMSGTFHGMHSLTHLNLSYNQLETLTDDMLNDTKKLQELHLQNNKLYQLPSALFRDLPELMILDLSSNQLSNHYIDSWIFSGSENDDEMDLISESKKEKDIRLKRLVVLNLANNALTRIESSHFRSLSFLQILDLRNNSIGIIHDRAFSSLHNLHTLNLSGNRMHIIGAGLFNNGGIHVLTRLVLSNNLITLIDTRAFRNCTSLEELDLSSNQLTEVPAAVRDLKNLKSLDLGENRINVLRNESFENMLQLTGLRLMDNLISNITNGIFYPLRGLHVLNLANNKIQNIERGAFDKNYKIEAIRLDKNLLTDINGIFATLNSLLWLNLSENQLVWFDYAFIPMNLKWLDIHSNFIEALGNYYRLQSEITITTLDASHNRITEIGSLLVPNSIELFFVNNNLIRNVYPNTFIDKQNLTRVDLYSNGITKLHVHSLRISAMASMKKNTEFYLSGNPFECDCSMGWLAHYHHQQQHHPRIMDYESIECLVTHTRNTPVRLLSSLSAEEFLCRYESKCPASCHCCEHTKCYCNIKCPDNCACFADQSGAINKINCGKQNALQIPERVPMDATDLFLDGNNFFELQSNVVFNKLRHLRSLYLNNSNVISIQPHAFSGLNINLQRLHLEDNKLTALYGNEFNALFSLKELYLQNNLLTYIENSTFNSLKHLQVLRLDGNRLTTLTSYQMHSFHLKKLKMLTLSRNLWSCSCLFLQEFIPFISATVTDSNNIQCIEDVTGPAIETTINNDERRRNDDENNKKVDDQQRNLLVDRSLANKCKNSVYSPMNNVSMILPPEGILHGMFPFMVFAFVLLFILAVIIVMFTIKEQKCHTYSSSNNTIFDKTNGNIVGMANKYDAVILSAKEDCDHVIFNVVNPLKQTKSQIHIGQQHNNVPTTKLLPSVYSSRKLIIYLTNQFIHTEWCRPEIRSAIGNSFSYPGKVILIQASNLSLQSNADHELFKNVGRSSVTSWISIEEPEFLYKLAYAIEVHPSHYTPPAIEQTFQTLVGIQHPFNEHQGYYSVGGGGPTLTSKKCMLPYNNIHYNEPQTLDKNDSYYSSATNTSILSRQFDKQTIEHVYIGIDDSDYGSATNEPTIHRSIAQPLRTPIAKAEKLLKQIKGNSYNSDECFSESPKHNDSDELSI
ncbi:toll-like receptor 7 [Contarinia nasturtii]|uniref:toll-like receptor 7 n=1 Tax=Contarinia nasturtii TaxID=265458 RepID=UPI0012D4A559|nr:toll-like receptor 7 [Contarinia nasturtii]